ncbi:MAG: PA14 domain-containing protein, partial [Prosthecobacter sp.]
SRPFGLVFNTAGTACGWLALEGTGQILRLNVDPGATLETLTLTSPVRHLSLSADGARLYASRFITPAVPGENTATPNLADTGGQIVVITTATLAVESTILLQPSTAADTQTSSRGLPNYLGAAVISPDGLSAWVPSKLDNIQRGIFRDTQPLNHENTLRAIVSRLDLVTQSAHLPSRIDIDNAGMPSAGAFDPWGIYVFTALEASREIVIIDSWSRQEVLRFPAGRAPQGVTRSPDGLTLYVHNFMDRSITVHDISNIIQGGSTAPVISSTLNAVGSEALSAQVLQGKKLFYDAKDPRLALQEYMSCASCHNDGGHDGRVWDLTGFGEGLRNTITLKGHGNHGTLHWTGNFDEVHDFEVQIRNLAGGTGLIASGVPNSPLGAANAGRSADLDALAAYVSSLNAESNSPVRTSSGTLTAAATLGQQVFRKQNCALCHSGVNFSNSALNSFSDIGTILPASGKRLGSTLSGLDVPTLRGTWATAPYLHDGRAATLSDAITAHQGLTLNPADLSNLVAFVQSIDAQPVTAPLPFTVTLSTPAVAVSGPFVVTCNFSAATADFISSDVTVTNGTVSGFSGSGAVYSFTVTPTTTGNVTLLVLENAATDVTTLANATSNLLSVTYAPSSVVAGLSGTYYAGKNFETERFTRIDNSLDFIWNGAPDPQLSADVFSVRWRGTLIALSTGSYDIITRTDDGVRLWLNGVLIIDNWTAHGETWDIVAVNLQANVPVAIRMDFYENAGSAVARLWWEGPGISFSAVPQSALRSFDAHAYPATYAEWLASPLAPPTPNADGDDLSDLLEYALGTSATSGLQPPDSGLQLIRGSGNAVDVMLLRPAAISDVTYTLETSPDLIHWDATSITPVVTNENTLLQRITWPNVHQSAHLFRLRVTQP